MILQPIAPWWVLLMVFAPFAGFIVWRLIVERRYWVWIRRFLLVLVVALMSVRPSVPGGMAAGGAGLLDVYFVIDTTTSMTAEDYDGTKQRLDGVRHDARAIAAALAGARFSVVNFDNSARVVLPLTNDATAAVSAVETTLAQEIFYGTGSTIDAPIDILKTELGRTAKSTPDRGRIVFYFGDGEQTKKEKPKSFEEIKPLLAGGAVLGYGTSTGAKMVDVFATEYDKKGTQYIKDYSTGEYPAPEAISTLDESNLRAIGSQAGLRYFHRDRPTDVDAIISDINVSKIIQESREVENYTDLYWIGAVVVVALLSIDVWPLYRASRQLHQLHKKGAE